MRTAQGLQINSIDLLAYLTAIANGHATSHLDELLPRPLKSRVKLKPRGDARSAYGAYQPASELPD